MKLYCDPSARAFGYVLMDGNIPIQANCLDFLEGHKGTFATKSRIITQSLTKYLMTLNVRCGNMITHLVTEVPTGSQSVNVAWYLSAIQSTLLCYCTVKGITYIPVSESSAKKTMHGRTKKVKKEETIKFILDNYPEFSYLIESKKKAEREAISDALAIYHYHRSL